MFYSEQNIEDKSDESDGKHCDDVNECLYNPCSSNGYCSNTLGSFLCSCNAGYAGNGYECTSVCGPCNPNYCANGQPCSRVGSTCVQKCNCHPMFSDNHCLEAGNRYIPDAAENTPQRTIHLRMTSLENITAEEAERTVAQFMSLLPVDRFVNTSNFRIFSFMNSMFQIRLISKFSYNGNITTIKFLNEQLINAIKNLISNGSIKTLTATLTGNITFKRVRDGQYYTLDQLVPYFTCSLYDYSEYTLNKETFTCESNCKTTCQNNATCVHMKDEIICRCKNFSMYITSGTHCENLSMNLNAFFGILFGALAFLVLILLAIGLCVRYCLKRQYQEKDAENCIPENIFQKKTAIISSKIRRPTIPAIIVPPEEPSLVKWSPGLDNQLSGLNITRPNSQNGESTPNEFELYKVNIEHRTD
ncbi:mucin-4-like [Ranitomeya variabilis]|uniref:mucin-4-like n=1 Tax=Ranitomeya variabilis TaxID=490064 RepID=UPI0040571011